MHRIIFLLVATLGLTVSATVWASGSIINSGVKISPNDCGALEEAVAIHTSKYVQGAYQCDATNWEVRVATCHEAGSREGIDVACTVIGVNADGSPLYNDASCDGSAGQTFQVINARAFVATTGGGSVGIQDVGSTCTAGNLTGMGFFN